MTIEYMPILYLFLIALLLKSGTDYNKRCCYNIVSNNPNMGNCKLCNSEIIGKVGSHTISEFLFRRAFAYKKSNLRDNEILFNLGGNNAGRGFIGRNITDGKLNEKYNEELELDINEMMEENPFVDNSLVCRPCESIFGVTESKFSTIYKEFELQTKWYRNEVNEVKKLFKIFSLINLWRIGNSTKNESQIPVTLNSQISNEILKIKGKTYQEQIELFDLERSEIKKLKFCYYYIPFKDDIGLTIYYRLLENLYFIAAGQFLIFIYNSYPPNLPTINYLNGIISKNSIRKNLQVNERKVNVIFFSDKQIERYSDQCALLTIKNTLDYAYYKFKVAYYKKFKCLPLDEMEKYVKSHMIEAKSEDEHFTEEKMDEINQKLIQETYEIKKKKNILNIEDRKLKDYY